MINVLYVDWIWCCRCKYFQCKWQPAKCKFNLIAQNIHNYTHLHIQLWLWHIHRDFYLDFPMEFLTTTVITCMLSWLLSETGRHTWVGGNIYCYCSLKSYIVKSLTKLQIPTSQKLADYFIKRSQEKLSFLYHIFELTSYNNVKIQTSIHKTGKYLMRQSMMQ